MEEETRWAKEDKKDTNTHEKKMKSKGSEGYGEKKKVIFLRNQALTVMCERRTEAKVKMLLRTESFKPKGQLQLLTVRSI